MHGSARSSQFLIWFNTFLAASLCLAISGTVDSQVPEFRQLFEKHSAIMLLIEPETGRIVDANQAAAAFYGYSREALLNMSMQQINVSSPEQMGEKRNLLLHQKLASGEQRKVEVFSDRVDIGQRSLSLQVVHDISLGPNIAQGLARSERQLTALLDKRSAEMSRQHLTIMALVALVLILICTFLVGRAIRRRHKAEDGLESMVKLFDDFLERATDFIYFKDADSRILYCSNSMAAITGHSHWRKIRGKHDREIFRPDVARIYEEEERAVFSKGQPVINKTNPYYDEHGQLGYVQTSKWPRLDRDGQVIGIFGISVDVTKRILRERQLRQAASVFEHTSEGIVITDADVRIVEVNEAFTQITGYQPEDVIGRNPNLLSAGRDDGQVHAEMWRGLEANGNWSGEMWNRRKNGELYVQHTCISVVLGQDGKIESYVSLFHDVTSRVTYTDQLEYAAHHDPLTNLPNRFSLEQQLHQSMRVARRDRKLVAVLFADLDLFKPINDKYGHQVGDSVLIEVSRRLEQSVRDSDYVSRLGGDEFVVILNDLDAADDASPVAQKILERLALPYEVSGLSMNISISIGISIYPDDGDTNHMLLKAADKAMYAAKKRTGRNSYFYFSEIPHGDLEVNGDDEE